VGPDLAVQVTHALGGELPTAHFGFSSLLNQAAATTVSKVITLVGNQPVIPPASTATAIQGQIITYTVNVVNTSNTNVTLVDFLSPNMDLVGLPAGLPTGVSCSSGGTVGARPTTPAVNPNASRFTCTISAAAGISAGASGTNFIFTASVFAGDPLANVACIYPPGSSSSTPPASCATTSINAPSTVFPPLIPAPVPAPQVAIPAAPRPPVQFIPTAPLPLLPPPGPGMGMMAGAPPAMPGVPVIPEADTVGLLAGGLLALGALAWLRSRRRGD
jgi:uncharacterized repeat protein (TIGR01451 family)